MKIAVCVKFTPDAEDVKVEANGSIDISSSVWNVSDYDLQAIQAAADISTDGDEVIAISAGTSLIDQTKLTKALMSRGNLSSFYRIVDAGLDGVDTAVIARALAAEIKQLDVDIVLFGEGSSDLYARSTGAYVAAELGWPYASNADAIALEGDYVVVDRDLEDGIEVVELQKPCAIAVTSTINIPPIPNMKAVLAAGKKPVTDATLADLGVDLSPSLSVVGRSVPEKPGRRCEILEGSACEMAATLVSRLQAAQVL